MAERNDSLIELLQNRLQYLLVDKGEGTIPPVRVLAEDLAYIIQTTHQPDESTGFRIVKKGRWLTFCLDDSFINCQCIEEPFISQIVDAFNANATKREYVAQKALTEDEETELAKARSTLLEEVPAHLKTKQ